jgi:hypothetical protein
VSLFGHKESIYDDAVSCPFWCHDISFSPPVDVVPLLAPTPPTLCVHFTAQMIDTDTTLLGRVYVGCIMNHKEGAYEFIFHGGMRIRSTTANLRIVGDFFPFKYQQKRDLDLSLAFINPRVEELEDDDQNLIANVGSVADEH